jgi:hypothetical protein
MVNNIFKLTDEEKTKEINIQFVQNCQFIHICTKIRVTRAYNSVMFSSENWALVTGAWHPRVCLVFIQLLREIEFSTYVVLFDSENTEIVLFWAVRFYNLLRKHV